MGLVRESPFFHALVVAGAGISASDCGGVSADVGASRAGELDSGTTGGRGPATGGSSGAGGAAAAGGARASGGASASGGEAAGGLPVDTPPPPAETVAQWDCSGVFGICHYRPSSGGLHPLVLDGACTVDPGRPRTPADCVPAEWFACQAAVWAPSGETILVNCACVPSVDAGCEPSRAGARCERAQCDGTRLVCGCAEPVILR